MPDRNSFSEVLYCEDHFQDDPLREPAQKGRPEVSFDPEVIKIIGENEFVESQENG